jgi:Cu(I)/Ag(I) efflux system membrane protein CusA/SilA
MISEGTGAEVMQRIAAPMVGGMVTAPLLSMFVIPAAYLLLRRRGLRKLAPATESRHPPAAAPATALSGAAPSRSRG